MTVSNMGARFDRLYSSVAYLLEGNL
jgi:hypothetical protein